MTPNDTSWADRRDDERRTIDLPATIRAYRVGPFDTRLVDVSQGGAMIALEGALVARGDEMVLAAGEIELVSTVAWTADHVCGLAFHRKLTAAQMAAWRRAGTGRHGAPIVTSSRG